VPHAVTEDVSPAVQALQERVRERFDPARTLA
jgi:hypothetical protein